VAALETPVATEPAVTVTGPVFVGTLTTDADMLSFAAVPITEGGEGVAEYTDDASGGAVVGKVAERARKLELALAEFVA
jgi:hypothetical protein